MGGAIKEVCVQTSMCVFRPRKRNVTLVEHLSSSKSVSSTKTIRKKRLPEAEGCSSVGNERGEREGECELLQQLFVKFWANLNQMYQ